METEVNFEKRGKWILLILLLLTTPAYGQTVSYDFTTLDISVPGRPDLITAPVDINKHNTVLERTWRRDATGNPVNGGLVARPNNRRFSKIKDIELFDCQGTDPLSLNDAGQATGTCHGGAFLRQPDGTITILAGPAGALFNATAGFHVSTNGRVAGQFCVLATSVPGCQYRGFTWHPIEGYRTIDFIDSYGPGTFSDTAVIATTASGKALVEYQTADSHNNPIASGFAIYDNGVWSFPFPVSNANSQPFITMSDMTDDEQILFVFSPNDGTAGQRLRLFDDGRFYDVEGWPEGWGLGELNGVANETGAFVGTYGIPCASGARFCTEIHGFRATPAPQKLTKK